MEGEMPEGRRVGKGMPYICMYKYTHVSAPSLLLWLVGMGEEGRGAYDDRNIHARTHTHIHMHTCSNRSLAIFSKCSRSHVRRSTFSAPVGGLFLLSAMMLVVCGFV